MQGTLATLAYLADLPPGIYADLSAALVSALADLPWTQAREVATRKPPLNSALLKLSRRAMSSAKGWPNMPARTGRDQAAHFTRALMSFMHQP